MNFRNMSDQLISLQFEAEKRFQESGASMRSSSDEVQASIERRKRAKWRDIAIALAQAQEAAEHGMELATL